MDIILQSVLPFLGILLGLIVIHEAGHYITAKMFGVKVLEAGIGLPPKVWGFTYKETEYTINALPLGAFVRMLGEEDPSDPRSLAAQPKWKRVVIIASGAVLNAITAIVLLTISLMLPHPVSVGGAAIGSVVPDSPAARAGLQPGDQILEVNGRAAESTADAAYLIRLNQGNNIDFLVKRPDPNAGPQNVRVDNVYARWNPPTFTDACGVEHRQGPTGISLTAVSLAPITRTPEELADLRKASIDGWREYKEQMPPDAPAWCLGGGDTDVVNFGFTGLSAAQCASLGDDERREAEAIKAELFPTTRSACYVFEPGPAFEVLTETRRESLFEAIPNGTRLAFETIILTRNQIWSLVRGFGGTSPITGPVGIAQTTGEVVDQAGWQPLIALAASISMSLAIFNLLPIPMVDGGRLVFILIEFIRGGKRVSPEKEALVHFMGFVALIIFAVVVTWFDIVRIFNGDSLLR